MEVVRMKIEKVNDHQIRCTLTREDLAKRQLKVSELAYGTDKARELFQEMMRQANVRFGFNGDDVPLMIEAIPINSDCIVLVITKSEDPEELDTRFSQFGPSVHDDAQAYEREDADFSDTESEDDDEEVMDLFHKLQEGDFAGFLDGATSHENRRSRTKNRNRALQANEKIHYFRLNNMHEAIQVSLLVPNDISDESALLRDPQKHDYLLLLYQKSEQKSFDKVCRLLSEYAHEDTSGHLGLDYIQEHFIPVIKSHALQKLKNTDN